LKCELKRYKTISISVLVCSKMLQMNSKIKLHFERNWTCQQKFMD
jgi:hypothetical protein